MQLREEKTLKREKELLDSILELAIRRGGLKLE